MPGFGGITWNVITAASYAIDAVRAQAVIAQIQAQQAETTGEESNGYRPGAWGNQALQTTIIVPGAAIIDTGSTTAQINQSGAINPNTGIFNLTANEGTTQPTPDTILIFDAIFRHEHEQEIRATEHPVQNGANISDDAIILPARLTLEIGMSDTMDAYVPGQWSDAPSKSVSCFQTLITLAMQRQPLTVTTRLRTYTGMIVERVSAPDDAKTTVGLRVSVTLKQIFIGTVTTTPVSTRPHTTDDTNIGTKPSLPLNPTTEAQHTPLLPTTSVPNPGQLSSNVEPDGS